ncbi:MAG: preprotein translocase subunit SecG [Alphaproteobacteria bacterium]|nr:preprotein translocase subunit SecG [Alphaproteobacteria bacterium]MCW5740039.1 preprotein translocase subunit SecG [Alphaproteobacteria bacterium]
MQNVVLALHALIAVAMVVVVLLQRSEGGGLGMGRSSDGMMSVRGQANLLTRTTAILAAVFFATSIALAVFAGTSNRPPPIIPTGPSAPVAPGAAPTPGAAPAPATPAPPTAPAAPTR